MTGGPIEVGGMAIPEVEFMHHEDFPVEGLMAGYDVNHAFNCFPEEEPESKRRKMEEQAMNHNNPPAWTLEAEEDCKFAYYRGPKPSRTRQEIDMNHCLEHNMMDLLDDDYDELPDHDKELFEFLERMDAIRKHQDRIFSGKIPLPRGSRNDPDQPKSLQQRFRDWYSLPENRPEKTLSFAGPEWLQWLSDTWVVEQNSYPVAEQHKREYEEEFKIYEEKRSNPYMDSQFQYEDDEDEEDEDEDDEEEDDAEA